MFDWWTFGSGVAGTLVGASVAFVIFTLWRHRRQVRKRHEAVRLIDSELTSLAQSMLVDEVSGAAEMSPVTRLQLTHTETCIGSLRKFDRGRGRYVSEWASRGLGAMLTSPDPAERPRLAEEVIAALKEWDDRRRGWRWFRDDTTQHDWYDVTADVPSGGDDRGVRGASR